MQKAVAGGPACAPSWLGRKVTLKQLGNKWGSEMARSEPYMQGRRAGMKWAITWLHERAKSMNDPQAKAILDCAASDLGIENRTNDLTPHAERQIVPVDADLSPGGVTIVPHPR
jgi:hypothetical protein